MVSSGGTIRLRLTGGRFNQGRLPFSFGRDMEALHNALREAAKAIYLAERPGRRHVPAGFSGNIEPSVVSIASGSTDLGIESIPSASGVAPGVIPLFPEPNYLFQAWDMVIRELSGEGEVPTSCSSRLRNFGASFKDDEAAIFYSLSDGTSYKYDREARRHYIATRFPDQYYTERTYVSGFVFEYDARRNTFQIAIEGDIRIRAETPNSDREQIRDALAAYDQGNPVAVMLAGEVHYSRGNPVSISDISEVTLVASRDIPGQIGDLASLPDDWAGDDSVAINREGLVWLRQAFDGRIEFDQSTMPYLYPTEDGNVQAEWTIGSFRVDLFIDLETHHAVWGESDLASDHNYEHELCLDEEEAWKWIDRRLLEMVSGTLDL